SPRRAGNDPAAQAGTRKPWPDRNVGVNLALVLWKELAMHELFLLIAIIVATVVVMGGMLVLFKGYFNKREEIDRAAGR
ncbi:MAG: hypothetical protein QGF20_07785, partial [Alphaproteobacteria bacterium]|nr:hypothetical protein [Alphaproteobacteria bacterium]